MGEHTHFVRCEDSARVTLAGSSPRGPLDRGPPESLPPALEMVDAFWMM